MRKPGKQNVRKMHLFDWICMQMSSLPLEGRTEECREPKHIQRKVWGHKCSDNEAIKWAVLRSSGTMMGRLGLDRSFCHTIWCSHLVLHKIIAQKTRTEESSNSQLIIYCLYHNYLNRCDDTEKGERKREGRKCVLL